MAFNCSISSLLYKYPVGLFGLHIIIALVLTGMFNYSELNVGDPLAFVFDKLHLKSLSLVF